jgi:ABC-type transport system substrate-binding protein
MPNASQVAEVVQKYLEDVGFKTKLWKLEYGTYLTYCRTKDKRAGHMALSQFAIDYDPTIRFMMSMMSTSQYGYYKTGPQQKEMDNLILAQSSETNPQKRLAILKKIQEINNADPAQITLLGINQIYAMNKRIDYTWESWRHFFRGFESIKKVK